MVVGKEALDGGLVGGPRLVGFAKLRQVPAALAEVLVARGALLAIPALLVHQDDCREQAEPLNREGHMGQVGDRAMAVLEVEGVQELLGALAGDLAQRFLHGER